MKRLASHEDKARARKRITRARLARLAAFVLAVCTLPALGWMIAVRFEPFPVELLARARASSPTVLDAEGGILWQGATVFGGRQSWVGLSDISPHLVHATLAGEDHRFFRHGGVDPVGVVRAAWLNLIGVFQAKGPRTHYGGSTLTMQLVRVLTPVPWPRDVRGKLRQALYAARLERVVDKATILEHYLNRIYYGHGAFGVEAAAQRYFGKTARALSAGEAAFLAVLPRGPGYYDPQQYPERLEARRRAILLRMEALGFLDAETGRLARAVRPELRWQRPGRRAPHFVDYILNTVPPEALRGARIHTTLDTRLQERLEIAVDRHLESLGRGVGQAALVVLRNSDGAILAMVGSRDYDDVRRNGAANGATMRRRPGSTLKPYVYGLALERGDSPATLAYDVVLPGESHESYTGDVKQHGFARYREALAGSYNLAAVHVLKQVGVRTLVERLRAAGLSTLDRPDRTYDAALAIGEAEFTLLEYAGAFAAFGTAGRPVRPFAITLHEQEGVRRPWPRREPLAPVFSAEVAYQIFDILSDPDARRPMFGLTAPMALPFPVALKTGTTRAYTDTLAFGTTRAFTVGAWAGNFDGSPTEAVMAMQGAAPLVRAAFVALAALYGDPAPPVRPAGLVERYVCPLSGAPPGPACPTRKLELFRADALPAPGARCTFHELRDGRRVVVLPPELQGWARVHGIPHQAELAPRHGEHRLTIAFPSDGARFVLDPHRSPEHQRPPLRALPRNVPVRWTIDGQSPERFLPAPGLHRVEARLRDQVATVTIAFD